MKPALLNDTACAVLRPRFRGASLLCQGALLAALILPRPLMSAAAAEPDDEARVMLKIGYDLFQQASDAEDLRHDSKALRYFTGALQQLIEVRAKYPDWNKSIIDFRIGHCKKRIRQLRRELVGTAKGTDPELRAQVIRLKKKMLAAQQKIGRYRTDRIKLKKALQKARQEAARTSELEDLLAAAATDKAARNVALEKLVKDLEAANDEVAELSRRRAQTVDARVRELDVRVKSLLEQGRLKDARYAKSQSVLAQRSQAIKKLREDGTAAAKQGRIDARTIKGLHKENGELDDDLARAKRTAAGMADLKLRIKAQKKEIRVLRKTNDSVNVSLARLNRNVEVLKKRAASKEVVAERDMLWEEKEKVIATLTRTEQERATLSAALQKVRVEAARLVSVVGVQKKEIGVLRKSNESANTSVVKLRHEVKVLQKRAASEKVMTERDVLREEKEKADAALVRARQELRQLAAALDEARAEASSTAFLKKRLQEILLESQTLKTDNSGLKDKIRKMVSELSKGQKARHKQLDATIVSISRSKKLLMDQHDALRADRMDLAKEMTEARIKLKRLSLERETAVQKAIEIVKAVDLLNAQLELEMRRRRELEEDTRALEKKLKKSAVTAAALRRTISSGMSKKDRRKALVEAQQRKILGLEVDIRDMRKELQIARAALETGQEEASVLRQRNLKQRERRDELRAQLKQLRRDKKKGDDLVALMEKETADLKEKNQAFAIKIESQKAINRDLMKKTGPKLAEKKRMMAAIDEGAGRIEALLDQSREVWEQKDKLEVEILHLQQELDTLKHSEIAHRTAYGNLQNKKVKADKEAVALKEQIKEIKERVALEQRRNTELADRLLEHIDRPVPAKTASAVKAFEARIQKLQGNLKNARAVITKQKFRMAELARQDSMRPVPDTNAMAAVKKASAARVQGLQTDLKDAQAVITKQKIRIAELARPVPAPQAPVAVDTPATKALEARVNELRTDLEDAQAVITKQKIQIAELARPVPAPQAPVAVDTPATKALEARVKELETHLKETQSMVSRQLRTIDNLERAVVAAAVHDTVKPGPSNTERAAAAAAADYRQLQGALDKLKEENRHLALYLAEQKRQFSERGTRTDSGDKSANISSLMQRGARAREKNMTEAATFCYARILQFDPTHLPALIQIGNLSTAAGDFEKAERYLLRAFYQDPDNLDVLLPLGYVLARLEKADMAISMLSRAAALYPGNPEVHCYLGVACRSLGWSEAAEVQFKRSFTLDKKNSDTAFNLAILYATLNPPRLDDAKQWYATARDLGAELDAGLERLFKAQ